MLTEYNISGMMVTVDTMATVLEAIYHIFHKEGKPLNFSSTLSNNSCQISLNGAK